MIKIIKGQSTSAIGVVAFYCLVYIKMFIKSISNWQLFNETYFIIVFTNQISLNNQSFVIFIAFLTMASKVVDYRE